MASSRRSEFVKTVLLSLVNVAGTLLLLEIGVRLFAPVPLVASDLFLVTQRLPEVQARTARRALKYPVWFKWVKQQSPDEVLDLLSGLGAAPEPNSLYYRTDKHLNARGHAVAAELITRFLKSSNSH